jgi:hypothetical protein
LYIIEFDHLVWDQQIEADSKAAWARFRSARGLSGWQDPRDLKHFASPKFWAPYQALPTDIRTLSDKNYDLLKSDSRHPSLHFKKLSDIWSVRVGAQAAPHARSREDGTRTALT